jgi:predicted DNA-binding transcriptional regulator AlpA
MKRKQQSPQIEDSERAFTVSEFCACMGISRWQYYNLKRTGRGPREMHIGSSVRISPEARKAWRALMERAK